MKTKLKKIPYGKSGWNEYEDIVCDILRGCLYPKYISEPLIQKVSPCPQIRRDILLPLTFKGSFWQYISVVYKGSLLIVECKNYTDLITPNEVNSTLRYVSRPAVSNLAFIASRKGASKEALNLAIDYYKTLKKLFIFINDKQLSDLIDLIGKPDNSTEYIRDLYNNQKAIM